MQRDHSENHAGSADGALYLLPNFLGSADQAWVAPAMREAVQDCTAFVVESHKMSRRLLKALLPDQNLDQFEFFVLHKDLDPFEYEEMFQPLKSGKNVALISDAGLPAVADPGSKLVAMAHRKGIAIRPIVGPSSLMLALMASGLNGQRFTFHGYLPHPKQGLVGYLKKLQMTVLRSGETQLFIETPYRNLALFDVLLKQLDGSVLLCLACDLTLPNEEIRTHSIAEWKRVGRPAIDKRPCVFLLGQDVG